MTDLNVSPLQKYYRTAQIYISLPSGKNFYKKDVLELSDSGEVGVMPMTAKDELLLTSPDGLLNGESLAEILRSCVKGLHNPKGLIINDIEVLMLAIQYATYGKKNETEVVCPACNHLNTFNIDLQNVLETVKFLNPPFPVNLSSGLTVFVRPYSYTDTMKALSMSLEQSKLKRIMEDQVSTEEQKLSMFGELFKRVSSLNQDLVVNCVHKVVSETDNINVEDKAQIKDFMFNISSEDARLVEQEIAKVNKITYNNQLHVTCQKCKHEWDSDLNLNPVNFSTAS